jgi:hypothetical protein
MSKSKPQSQAQIITCRWALSYTEWRERYKLERGQAASLLQSGQVHPEEGKRSRLFLTDRAAAVLYLEQLDPRERKWKLDIWYQELMIMPNLR